MSTFSVFLVAMLVHVHFASSTRPPMQISEGTKWFLEKNSRRQLGTDSPSCRTRNPIDDCWRCDPDWETNRKMLADCAIGFGRNAAGGRDGEFYIVTDPEHDNPVNPLPGTLRYAVIQDEPLWIIFDQDMVIQVKEELMMNSYKTIDGRGQAIEIANGPCITISDATNIIIHGVYIHDCVPAGNTMVRDSPRHYGLRGISDGNGISIFGARDLWIDHCTLARCSDGLIDAVYESTAITISNNYMFQHNEVMLLGHKDDFLADQKMQVTIAFNYFGEGLVQRMPRMQKVGILTKYYGSLGSVYKIINPVAQLYRNAIRLLSTEAKYDLKSSQLAKERNMYVVTESTRKSYQIAKVTKRESPQGSSEWKNWNWRSDGDMMLNGAFFTPSGEESPGSYAKASSMVARPASLLANIIPSAGVLNCQIGKQC